MAKKKKDLTESLNELAKILSGEEKLRKNAKKMEELKMAAVESQKEKRRGSVTKGEAEMVKDDPSEKKVIQKIDLYEWEAPIRYSFNFDSKVFMVVVALSMLFILFLAILGHYGLMAALIALLFFIYAAGTTEPIIVNHKITTRGVDTMDRLYEWFMLDAFFFCRKNDQYFLIVETELRSPGTLMMLVERGEMEPVFVLLQDKLLYKDIRKETRMFKLTYGEYIPLEKI
jgi:hypothetical protein